MLNPKTWLIVVVVLILSCAGSFYYGGVVKEDHLKAQMGKDAELERRVTDAALNGAATAISKIEVRNVYTRQTLEKETVTVPDYSRCYHSDAGLHALNDALTDSEPFGSSRVPKVNSTER